MHDPREKGEQGRRKREYIVRERLREGQVENAWNAFDPGLERPVIIKKLSDLTNVPDAMFSRIRKRFDDLTTMAHPGVSVPLDLFTARNGIFAVLENIPGISLRELVSAYRSIGRGVPPSVLVIIGNQLVRTLSALHAKGFFHGRLTPGPIVVNGGRDLKLTDFLFMPPENPDTRILGKYAAPEIRTGAVAPGIPSDIYASAIILYDMIAVPEAVVPGKPRKASLPDWFDEYSRFFAPALNTDPGKRTYAFAGILEALKRIEVRYLNRTDLERMERLLARLMSSSKRTA